MLRDSTDGAAVGPVASAGDERRLAQAHANAVVLADSHGDPAQAAKILGGALGRAGSDADAVERMEALAFLAELRVRVDDPAAARTAIADAAPSS